MKWILVGRSSIAQRRVLPALRSHARASAISIASSRPPPEADAKDVVHYADYESGIASSGADIAYISLENSDHARWTERALMQGMHVVVDKPAFLSYEDATRLARLAKARGLCLAEAAVFGSHPQVEALRGVFTEASVRPTRAFAALSFPPLRADDFRYRRERGGGALYDLGSYVAATSRLVFGAQPASVTCRITERQADGLDIGFSVLLTYEGEGALVGHYGFNTEYQNRLLVFGPGAAAELQRAFTLPPDTGNQITVRRNNVESVVKIAPADSFGLFLSGVVAAIGRRDWTAYEQALLQDAALVRRLIDAANET